MSESLPADTVNLQSLFAKAVAGRYGVRLAFLDKSEAETAFDALAPSYVLSVEKNGGIHLTYLIEAGEAAILEKLVERWQVRDTSKRYVEFEVLSPDEEYRLDADDVKQLEEGKAFEVFTVGEIGEKLFPADESESSAETDGKITKRKDAKVYGTIPAEILEKSIRVSSGKGSDEKRWKTSSEAPFGVFFDNYLAQHKVGRKDGHCFVPGALIGGKRSNMSVQALYMMGLDVDSGESLDTTFATIQRLGLFAVLYTTHSHGSTVIEVRQDKFYQWADKHGKATEPTDETAREFLTFQGKYHADVIAAARYVETVHESTGVNIKIETRPIDKFRIVFLLEEPYVIAKQHMSQRDAIKAWREMILGMARTLGIRVDRAATDCSRLFYAPRHAEGNEFRILVNGSGRLLADGSTGKAKLLDWTTIERVKSGKDHVSSDPFAQLGHAMGGSDKPRPESPNGVNLMSWASKHAAGFMPSLVFADHCPERIRREQSRSKFTVECPFDDEHSNPGDPEDMGCFIEDAGEAETFSFRCSHDACADRDRLDMLAKAMADEWFHDEVLIDNRYSCLAVEDEEEVGESVADVSKPKTHYKKMKDAVAALNDEIAIVQRGGDAVIYQKRSNGEGWLKLRAARDIYAPWTAGEDGDSAFSAWLKSSTRDHRSAVVFEPFRHGERDNTPPDHLNMYRGFAIEPVAGDWIDLQRHIFRIICNGDKRLFAYFIAWLADMVQNPRRKIGTALAILSVEGTGKSLFTDFVRQIWGARHSVKVSDPRQLTGNFNGHMSGKMLAVAEEAFFAGDPKIDSIIKDMITSDRMMMENKFMDAIEVGDFRRFILLSNAENVVRATGDARRYAVTVASAEMKGNTAYFQKLAGQLAGGKVAAAMLFDLLHLDIAGVERDYSIDLRNPPLTDALISQILINMKAEDRWLRSVLADGTFPDADGDSGLTDAVRAAWEEGPISVSKETVYVSYRSMVKGRDGREVAPEAISMFFVSAFRRHKGDESLIAVRGNGTSGRNFELPSLPSLREFYAEKSKVPLDQRSVVTTGDLILPPKSDDPDYDAKLIKYSSDADTFIKGVLTVA